MSDLYDPRLVEHARNPHNRGALPDAHRTCRVDNPLCGDRVTVALDLDGDRITRIRFEGRGCAIATASASVMTGLVEGATLREIARLQAELRRAVDPLGGEVEGDLGLFCPVRTAPSRRRCATLPWEALEQALVG